MITSVDAQDRTTRPHGFRPIVWSDEDRIGIPDIDSDHRNLALLFNELFTACAVGAGGDIIGKAAQAVIALTEKHFVREERFLETAAYPDLEAQRREHAILLRQLHSFLTQLTADGTPGVDVDLLGFLRDWAIRHILGHDRPYISFLTQQRTQS